MLECQISLSKLILFCRSTASSCRVSEKPKPRLHNALWHRHSAPVMHATASLARFGVCVCVSESFCMCMLLCVSTATTISEYHPPKFDLYLLYSLDGSYSTVKTALLLLLTYRGMQNVESAKLKQLQCDLQILIVDLLTCNGNKRKRPTNKLMTEFHLVALVCIMHTGLHDLTGQLNNNHSITCH